MILGIDATNIREGGGLTHLKEILEYIEAMNVSYGIDPYLIGSHYGHASVLFTIKSYKKKRNGDIIDEKIVARGERYDSLSREFNGRRITPAVCMSIDLDGGSYESYKKVKPENWVKPQLYFIHLGRDARRYGLVVVDTLRVVNVPLVQSLVSNSLAPQVAAAERMNVPYALIMGLKEVQEKSVIVRDMFTRAQETVPLDRLVRYLKKVVK